MSRTEFLEKLREALDQNVSPHVVRENVDTGRIGRSLGDCEDDH